MNPESPRAVPPPFRKPTKPPETIVITRPMMLAGLGVLGFVFLLFLVSLFNSGSNETDYTTPSSNADANRGGSFEDRMATGAAELGGSYDYSSGTIATPRD